MPLLSSFVLSSKKGKAAYLVPEVSKQNISFKVSPEPPQGFDDPKKGLKRGTSGIFECVACKAITTRDYVAKQAQNKLLGVVPTAVVVQAKRGRLYLSTDYVVHPETIPEVDTTGLEIEFAPNPRDLWCRNFGLYTPADLFTSRQLVALTTFSDLVNEVRETIQQDAMRSEMPDSHISLNEGGTGATAYAEAVAVYLGLGVSKLADALSSLTRWRASADQVISTFARQALPMVWDYAESNTFNGAAGDYLTTINTMVRAIKNLGNGSPGCVTQQDATAFVKQVDEPPLVFTTDPPYYDNISYAELSDFFYVWLRRTLGSTYPELFSTIGTPKKQELVYAPHRFGGDKEKARQFFEDGLRKAFRQTYRASHPDYPFTVFYAFKQAETDEEEDENGFRMSASTGWETMLESLVQAKFSITGTWPMRTERGSRTIASETNALASSIALVCRPLPDDAKKITRRDFLNQLKHELPDAIKKLQQGNIAPVDLAQASIGPGMAVFSRYTKVLESDGSSMRVRTALQLINQTLDAFLTEQEGAFDDDTRWALAWFEQHQFTEGLYGDAETLSKAKVTSVQGLVNAGILSAKGGKVRLLRRDELPQSWNPANDSDIPDWEATQHLIQALDKHGETGASTLLAQLNGQGEAARDLAYRLYSLCDRKGWTQEAIAYNSLVSSWSEISRLAVEKRQPTPVQGQLGI